MKTTLAIVLALAILLTCTAGCSRCYRFTGVVVDGQGFGIADAEIVLYPHDQQRPEASIAGEKTEADGTFIASWCGNPNVQFFRMVVSKPGYDSDTRIVSAGEVDIRVVLSQGAIGESTIEFSQSQDF